MCYFKQKTAYEMRISDWSSDVCSSDLNADLYDEAIRKKTAAGMTGEALFLDLALEDLTRAADLFRPVHDAPDGIDGWVSLAVSPLDRKSVVSGKNVSVLLVLGVCRLLKKITNSNYTHD